MTPDPRALDYFEGLSYVWGVPLDDINEQAMEAALEHIYEMADGDSRC